MLFKGHPPSPFAFAHNHRGKGGIIIKVIELQLNQSHAIDSRSLLCRDAKFCVSTHAGNLYSAGKVC